MEPETILETADDDQEQEELDAQAAEDRQSTLFRGVRCLLEQAKSRSSTFSSTFVSNWQFLLGENHWPIPKNSLAAANAATNNMSIRNWLFAICDHKAGALLSERQEMTVIPTGAPIDITQRWKIQEIMQEENRRLHAEEFDEDVLWDGMACGKGFTRICVVTDPRSGLKKAVLESMDPSKLYVDPDADRLNRAEYAFYEVWMPSSKIRRYFPKTWKKVKFDRMPVATTEAWAKLDLGQRRTDSDILSSGAGREFVVNPSGELMELGAKIAFSWFVNEEVIQEVERVLTRGEHDVCTCAACGCIFEPAPVDPYDAPEMVGMQTCPDCGSSAVATLRVPAEYDEVPGETRFVYPHGRYIVTCEDGFLFDGPNPDEIDDVFPIAEYDHYRVPHRFHGYGEVQHLRHSQLNANKNMAQLMDYLRTSVNGVLEYPQQADIYKGLGNAPNARIGLPINLIGLARYLPPASFNLQAFVTADETIRRDFQQMSGISDISTGLAPTAPTSGEEVRQRAAFGGIRMGGHRRRLNEYQSVRSTKLFQVLWQHKDTAEYYPIRNADGSVNVEALALQELPRGVRIAISTHPEDLEKNKLTAQVIQQWTQAGLIPFWPDILLPATGMPTYDSMALMQRMELAAAQQKKALQDQAAADPTGEATLGPMPPVGAIG